MKNAFAAVRGDKTAMRPLAKLLWQDVKQLAYSALMLLVGHQEDRASTCKKLSCDAKSSIMLKLYGAGRWGFSP